MIEASDEITINLEIDWIINWTKERDLTTRVPRPIENDDEEIIGTAVSFDDVGDEVPGQYHTEVFDLENEQGERILFKTFAEAAEAAKEENLKIREMVRRNLIDIELPNNWKVEYGRVRSNANSRSMRLIIDDGIDRDEPHEIVALWNTNECGDHAPSPLAIFKALESELKKESK